VLSPAEPLPRLWGLSRLARGRAHLARLTAPDWVGLRSLALGLRPLAAGLLLFLLLLPIVAVAQQMLLLLAARLLGDLTTLFESQVLPVLPLDPVYAGAALSILGGIQPAGLALAGWPGWALHGAAPGLFGSPEQVAPGAIVSGLLGPGATVAAKSLTTLLAAAASLALIDGLVGLAQRSPALWLAASMARVWLLLGLVGETALDVRELDATGLPFAFAALSPVAADGQRALLTKQLEQIPEPAVELATGLAAVLLCLGLALAPRMLSSIVTRRPRLRWRTSWRSAANRVQAAAGVVLLAGVVVLTPLEMDGTARPATLITPGIAAASDTLATAPAPAVNAEVATSVAAVSTEAPAVPPPTALPAPTAVPAPAVSSRGAGGSMVTISGGGYRYSLAVNGEPTVVRGMGYNPWYAKLSPDERRPRYARDFSAMHDIGVNTLEGWFQEQFDEITLDEAHQHGLGVILPFELNQDYDYGDPAVQARFRAQITDWVLRYRDNPALLMWGPGNEVMHRLIFPTAVQGKRDPAQEKRADDFAAFYVQLIDLIHELDPDHPVIYRDAEDLYFARLRQALLKDGQRRPWFIYGTNVYTQRLATVIENWPKQGLDAPLLVSEFSPGGVGPAERPRMLGWYWSTIRAHPERVLGGVVYTWATGGPEDLDRVFGLTDDAGKPVDGSIAALRALFRAGDGSAGGS
jgi:hypothetical protein